MIDITDSIINRIQSQCPVFTTVGHPIFLDIPNDFSQQTPAAFPWLASDKTIAPPENLHSSQQITQSYGIWIVTPRHQLEQARVEISQALLGWQHENSSDAMHYQKGAVENISADLIWWREYWALPIWIRQQ